MQTTSIAFAAIAAALVTSIGARSAHAQTGAPVMSPAAACKALEDTDFTGIIDAPARVASATVVEANGDVPAYCAAKGDVAPSVGFLLRMPASHWNGKFYELGCGGYCGNDNPTHNLGAFLGAMRRGYAYLVFDGGHIQPGTGDSALWAYNNLQAQIDFGFRAAHVAALAGKAITERYYGKAPAKSYFSGCSSGGQQALSEAQRFPWDFDGIIVGAPSPTFSGPMMYYLWAGRTLFGKVNQRDLQLVHDRTVQECDMDDGVKDGVIGDPKHCKFDPVELLCKPGQKTACLSATQVEAVKKVYRGPTTSKGETIGTGGPMPGSELNWINDESAAAYASSTGVARWPGDYFSYVGFMPAPGPGWKISDFDFDRDYKRLRMAESLFGAADNPDLRKFKAAGGKLIMYQGWQDQSDIPTDAIDYYETAEKTMGGRAATQDFFRLFTVPGMNHCTSGPGAFAVDYLDYLEAWVEKDRAPDVMIGAHVKVTSSLESVALAFPLDSAAAVTFTRPIYPYPIQAKYKGVGDPNDAANWQPRAPQ